MPDDITTTLKFIGDVTSADEAIKSLMASLQRAARQVQDTFGAATQAGNNGSGAFDKFGASAKRTEQALKQGQTHALALAQATARLQAAQGNLSGAAQTLQNALAGVNQQTIQAIRAQTQLAQIQNRDNFLRFSSTLREAGESIQQAGFALLGLTGAIIGLGRAAVRSAIDIDRQVNTLKALTGSAAAAEARFKALFELAQRTPGLTTRAAAALDAQLRLARVNEQTIDRFLKTVGRLNAIQGIGDPQEFANNLRQLVDQGFDKADLKQVVNRNPIAGELIKQVFGVDNPVNAEAIRTSAERLGIRTAEQFFNALAQAGENNPRLQAATESLAVQLEKAQDRLVVALRPLGVRILDTIIPAIEQLVPVVEAAFSAFAKLPAPLQTAVVALAALTAAIGPAVIALGGLIQTAGAIGNLITVVRGLSLSFAGFATIPALLNPIGIAIAAITAVVGVGALVWANYETAAERAAKTSVSTIKTQQGQIDSLKQLQAQAQSLANTQGTSAEQHAKLRAIINQLDPDTRAYINAIGDEQTAIVELNRVLKEQIALKQGDLSRNLGDIGDAANDLQKKIDRSTRALAVLEQQSKV
ncbi:MAG: hypothetical protein L0Z53_04650, partial [Acidobacteriales bacterium]|nr:hypothetical protein [Terriglobales bacterium]